MSPKKRKRRKPGRPDTTPTSTPTPGEDHATTTAKISRTPVVVADPPDRRITALWVALTLLWLLGTPLALANLLFNFMDLQDTLLRSATPGAQPPPQSLDAIGNALIWVLVLGLVVPAASAVTALLLKRRIAAIGFTAALIISALPLLWVMPPAELWDALTTHLFG